MKRVLGEIKKGCNDWEKLAHFGFWQKPKGLKFSMLHHDSDLVKIQNH